MKFDPTLYVITDSTYHTKTTTGGEYCCFCYGTNHKRSSVLERDILFRLAALWMMRFSSLAVTCRV